MTDKNKMEQFGEKLENAGRNMQDTGMSMMGCGCGLILLIPVILFIWFLLS